MFCLKHIRGAGGERRKEAPLGLGLSEHPSGCGRQRDSPLLDPSAPLLKCSRLTVGGRLGLAGAGPRAKMLTRGFFLGPVVAAASPLKLLDWGDGFLRLGFLLAAGLGGGVAVGGALLAPSGSSGPPASLLKIL